MIRKLFMVFVWVVLAGCSRPILLSDCIQCTLISCLPYSFATRAANPDDLKITDCNILVYNAFGDLEERVFLPARSLQVDDGELRYRLQLLQDVPYTIVCAYNFGFALPAMTLAEARSYRYYMAYPDEYSRGLPMVAVRDAVMPGDTLQLQMRRLMARVDLQVDRSGLPADAFLKITDVEVTGCPCSATLFPGSRVEETFRQGFLHHNREVQPLNRSEEDGISETVSLYILENLGEGTGVEIRAEYHSDMEDTGPGERRRFHLDLPPLERNGVYPVIASF